MPKAPLTRVYDLEYFTSSQSALYIGDVLIDEITSLQWVTQQNKVPLYGYASQLFDDTAAGTVIVQGSFSINYKEQGYLWAVLRRWHQIDSQILQTLGYKDPVDRSKSKALFRNILGTKPGVAGGRPALGSNGTRIARQNIERIVQGNATKSERYEFYQKLAGYASFDIDGPQDRIFEDIVEAFEDEVWKTNDNTDLLEQVRRTDNNIFDGFDMYFTAGNYAVPRANHTVCKIIGVRLLSQGKSIQMDDMPIQEEYHF